MDARRQQPSEREVRKLLGLITTTKRHAKVFCTYRVPPDASSYGCTLSGRDRGSPITTEGRVRRIDIPPEVTPPNEGSRLLPGSVWDRTRFVRMILSARCIWTTKVMRLGWQCSSSSNVSLAARGIAFRLGRSLIAGSEEVLVQERRNRRSFLSAFGTFGDSGQGPARDH